MSHVLLSIDVAARRVNRSIKVVGPPNDHLRRPFADSRGDRNANVPPTASATRAEPFGEHDLTLDPGIHIHWTLPYAITHGSTRQDDFASVAVDEIFMPPAPNRWLIYRRGNTAAISSKPTAAWFVESDAVIADTPRPPLRTTVIPLQLGRRPNSYIGRQVRLDPTTLAVIEPGPDSARTLADVGVPLTALGPGDPTFAAFYPGCQSVFGLHDPDLGQFPASYTVFGWYSPEVADPIKALLKADPDDPLEALTTRLGSPTRVSLELDHGDIYETMCAGQVVVRPGQETRDPAEAGPSPTSMAIGNNATEAFAALLASRQRGPRDANLEARLVTALGAHDLLDHHLDLPMKAAEARHSAQFRAHRGPKRWVVRGDSIDVLDETAGHALNKLNEAQRSVDELTDHRDFLRQQVFDEWHAVMAATYTEDNDGVVVPSPDRIDAELNASLLPSSNL